MRRRLPTTDASRARAVCRAPIATLALVLAALLSGCNHLGKPNPADRPVPDDQIKDFAVLYKTHCAGCHGADGQMGPAPPLNDAMFLAIVPDDVLLHLVDRGRPGTPMPAFSRERGGPLTKEQVRIVAEGIKPHWKDSAKAHPTLATAGSFVPRYAVTPPADQAEATEAAARGLQRFAQACGDCHGAQGQGDDTAGPLNDPNFLALASDQMLRRIMITGRPDLGMPDFSDTDGRADGFAPLSSEEIDDLVALLAQWRKAAPGQTQPSANATGTAGRGASPLVHATRSPNQ